MKTLTFLFFLLFTSFFLHAEILFEDETSVQVEGEKVYQTIKDRIDVPTEQFKALPKFEIGKGKPPVSLADAIKLADSFFRKTLNVPFTEDNGRITIGFESTGGYDNPVWWYHIEFSIASTVHHLGIPMNGKVYAATTTTKQIKDTKDPLKASGIPFLQGNKGREIHPLENELARLQKLPKLKSDSVSGIYLSEDGDGAYIFYPDGRLFHVFSVSSLLYKVGKDDKIYTTYTFGPKKDKIAFDTYIGVVKNGVFTADHGDYADFYYLKQKDTGKSGN